MKPPNLALSPWHDTLFNASSSKEAKEAAGKEVYSGFNLEGVPVDLVAKYQSHEDIKRNTNDTGFIINLAPGAQVLEIPDADSCWNSGVSSAHKLRYYFSKVKL